ncbi:zf-HC2 domain-containing protein [Mucilaginibacter phyllosphaerae]
MSNLKSMIYNCRQATFLIEKRMLGSLTFRERIELRIHLTGCDVCTLYVKQSQKINEMIKQLLKEPANNNVVLDDEFKEAMQQKIQHKLNNN